MWHVMRINFIFRPILFLAVLAMTSGCAGPIERWIVNTRVHQGEVALQHGNLQDAEVSYKLALGIDPNDQAARKGFVDTSAALAQSLYTRGLFDDSLVTISAGLKYDPTSVRLAALKSKIDDARLKREIVISNYPTYHDAGIAMQHAYQRLDVVNKSILTNLKRFSYTYDPEDLTAAIKSSYDLELDVARNTNRLIAYRQVVSSGVPESHAATTLNASSLLPLP